MNPNCSEMVFRLKGDLAQIKQEVNHMLDDIDNDYKEGSIWYERIQKRIEASRAKVNAITNLKEFGKLCFPYTTNYETFFKKEGNDLLVATCNNIPWDSVNYIPEDDTYYDIAPNRYGKIKAMHDSWLVIDDDKGLLFLDGLERSDKIHMPVRSFIHFRRVGKNVQIFADHLITLKPVTDQAQLTKIKEYLLAVEL